MMPKFFLGILSGVVIANVGLDGVLNLGNHAISSLSKLSRSSVESQSPQPSPYSYQQQQPPLPPLLPYSYQQQQPWLLRLTTSLVIVSPFWVWLVSSLQSSFYSFHSHGITILHFVNENFNTDWIFRTFHFHDGKKCAFYETWCGNT